MYSWIVIAVAAKEVDFWAVVSGVAAVERDIIASCSGSRTTQPEVAVGIDRELGVGVAAEVEVEPDVLHCGCYTVAAGAA